MLKVVHLSTNDISGGAARSAYRLHVGLRGIGVDSSMIVKNKTSNDDTVLHYNCGGMRYAWERWLADRKTRRDRATYPTLTNGEIESFSTDDGTGGTHLASLLGGADIVNLHWVGGFVNYREFFRSLPPGIRIVWTLHDMNCFTGGCHYSAGCSRFQQRCGSCPMLGSTNDDDLSREVFESKNAVFAGFDLSTHHVVAPSNWLVDRARISRLFGRFPSSVIPYGLDTNLLQPIDRAACRQVLGIPREAKVVLFVSETISNERKGFALLLNAISRLRDIPNLVLVSLGSSEKIDFEGLIYKPLGSLNNDNFLSAVFSAADVFVIPSLEDNLPNTLLEAMACGVPSVGFKIGGIPDVIREGVNGLLAEAGSADSLADRLKLILSDDALRAIFASNCRQIAVSEYPLELQATRYQSLYCELLGRPGY